MSEAKGPDQKGPDQMGMGAHLGGHLRENGMLMALVAIVTFFTIVVRVVLDVDFLSAQNITNLFLQNSYVIIMALGMLLVIVAGHIDLSVGSVVGFTGVRVRAWGVVNPAGCAHETEVGETESVFGCAAPACCLCLACQADDVIHGRTSPHIGAGEWKSLDPQRSRLQTPTHSGAFGGPAALFLLERRPVALRRRLSTGLPLSERLQLSSTQ